MGFDIGAHTASIFFSTPPATPRTFHPHTPSTPQSSGSSFSQTLGDTPCPIKNASVSLPTYSNAMEGVVFTSPKQAHSGQPATSRAPAKKPATAQPTSVLQPAPQPTPALRPEPAQPASQPQGTTGQATKAQPPAVPATKDAAASAPAWVTNDPGKVFKAPSWPNAIAPHWTTVKALPHLPPGGQVWDAAASAYVRAINDPALVFKLPSWAVTIAPLWASVEPLPRLPPGTQLWDAAASVYFWATNDPALVFKTPSWSAAIAPRWAAVQALPQLPPGTQVWEFKGSLVPAVPQPSTSNDPKPIPADQPVSSHPPAKHQPTIPSAQAPKEVIPEFSFEDSMQALVGQLTTCHVSMPDTWAWSEPSVFGMFMKDKSKRKGFHAHLVTMANTRPPASDGNKGLNNMEPQQDAQKAVISQSPTALPTTEGGASSSAIPQSSSDLPTTEDNGSPSASPDAMVQEQPSVVVAFQEKSAKPQPVEQADVPYSATPQSATAADVPNENGSSDEAMETEESQPTDQGVAEETQVQFSGTPQNATAAGVPNAGDSDEAMETEESRSTEKGVAEQIHVQFSSTPQTAAVTGVSINDDGAEAVETESSQPTENGKGVTVQGESDLTGSTFQFDNVPQLFAEVNNLFINAPTFPTSNPPVTVPQFGSQAPLFMGSTANETASQEQPYEVGSEEDPNVDLEFDFSKHFRRAGQAPAAATPNAPPASNSPAASSVEVPSSAETSSSSDTSPSPGEPSTPEASPRAETLLSSEASSPAGVSLPAEVSPDDPDITYDEEYAMNMMNDMFYDILPRLVSELLFPLPKWTEAEQEDEAKVLVDSMLEDELNERSFEMVQEAYEPISGVEFALCEQTLFNVFSDWFGKIIVDELPDLAHKMTNAEIMDLHEPFEDAVWKYIDDHPPKDLD